MQPWLSGARRLWHHPGFSIPALVTLSLALAAWAIVSSILQSVVLQPLSYPRPHELIRLWNQVPGMGQGAVWGLSKAQFLHYRGAQTFDALGLYTLSSVVTEVAEDPARPSPRLVSAARVSADLLEVLNTPVAFGRALDDKDNLAQSSQHVWLSHRFWQARFGGDPRAVGQLLVVDGQRLEVAGIFGPETRLPEEIEADALTIDLYLPLRLNPAAPAQNRHVYRALGRLRPETSRQSAGAELGKMTQGLKVAFPEVYSSSFFAETGLGIDLVPLHEEIVGSSSRVLWTTFGAMALLLVVAFGNLVNLSLSYSRSKAQDTAVRAALGARSTQAVAPIWIDVSLLGFLSAAIGLAASQWYLGGLSRFEALGIPRIEEIRLGVLPVVSTLCLALAAALALALLALSQHRGALGERLGTTRSVTSSQGSWPQRILVVWQIGFSFVLVLATLLLLQTSHRFARIDLGFDSQGVLTMPITFPPEEASSHDQLVDVMRRVSERVEALPGVNVAGFTAHLPLSGFDGCSSITLADPGTADGPAPCVPIYLVTPGYFETLGIEVAGEAPTWGDLPSRPASAIMSQALARRLWSDRRAPFEARTALGRQVGFGRGPNYEIVATAADVRAERPEKAPTEILYLPLVAPKDSELWAPLETVILVLRSAAGLPPIQTVHAALAEVNPNILVEDATALRTMVESTYVRQTLLAKLLGFASSLAFGLVCLGIYSIISLRIIHRRTEIGIRMALGATGGRIRRAIVMEMLPLVGLGLALGIAAALPAAKTLESLLLDVGAHDPATMLLAASLLVLAACSACWLPAWSATRKSPIESLS